MCNACGPFSASYDEFRNDYIDRQIKHFGWDECSEIEMFVIRELLGQYFDEITKEVMKSWVRHWENTNVLPSKN